MHSETDAELIISPDRTIEELKAETLKKLEQKKNIDQRFARVQISNRMRATLKSTDPEALAITPATSDTQVVTSRSDTRWLWKVRANKGGEYSLVFSLAAVLKIDGESSELVVETYSDKIEVSVGTAQWIKDFIEHNWQYLLSTLLIPIAIYAYKAWKKNGQPGPDPDAP